MINLLSEKKVKFEKKKGVALRIKMWAGVVLVGYIAIAALTLVVSQIYVLRINNAKKTLSNAQLELTSKVLLVEKYSAVVERAGVIKTILAKRRESIGLWNTVRSLVPEGVELTNFGLNENELRLGFEAPHVLLANQMLDVVESQFSQLGAAETEVGATRGSNAAYTISADVVLEQTVGANEND